MAPEGAGLADRNLGVQLSFPANGFNEVPKMRNIACGSGLRLQLPALGIIKSVTVAPGHGERSSLTIECNKRQVLLHTSMATAPTPDGHGFTEVKGCIPRVRSFLVIIMMVATTSIGDPPGKVNTKAPPGEVQRVDAIVGHLTPTIVPVPMPVVMNQVILVGTLGYRPLPKCVVQMGRNLYRFAPANASPGIPVPATGGEHLPDYSLVQSLDRLNNLVITPTLVSHLHKSLVPAGRLDHQLGFSCIVAARLFHIDVFPGRTSQDGGWGMPEIRRRNCQCVNLPIIQDFTEVCDPVDG